jgi:glycosyltransferase involved in cell wall biosynthesis
MARIATVYSDNRWPWVLNDMSYIRWQKISEALARLGHSVDIVTNEPVWRESRVPIAMAERLQRAPLEDIDWSRYDVVKTLFHKGFDVLERYGGARHAFVISKLGSVVAAEDRDGIYFYGDVRRKLYETQVKIHRTSRYVTVLSEPAQQLLRGVHGDRDGILLVPGGVDREIPAAVSNPFAGFAEKVCIFSGNVYFPDTQPEANRVLVDKLNQLGQHLLGSGIRVCFQGHGDTSRLDSRLVTHLGGCAYSDTWDFLRHASVGIVVSAGDFMHNNESTKLYHYLRAGLPVVSEQGFPNDDVVRHAGLGHVVPSGDMAAMAQRIREAVVTDWDRPRAIAFIQANHTWDCRVRAYRDILPRRPAGPLSRALRWLKLHPIESLPAQLSRRIALLRASRQKP